MPIYEYQCDKCHHEFEELVFGDQLPSCPQCGAQQSHKLMSRPCCHVSGEGHDSYDSAGSYSPPPSGGGGGGCAGCSGGNCANCK